MNPNELSDKIIDLEIRITHQEDHILSLDKTVYQQDKLLNALIIKIKEMEDKIKLTGENGILSSDKEAPPPHY